MNKYRNDFERCWNKLNAGTFIDDNANDLKKLIKYHSELIYIEAKEEQSWDFVKVVIATCGITIISIAVRMVIIPLWFPGLN